MTDADNKDDLAQWTVIMWKEKESYNDIYVCI